MVYQISSESPEFYRRYYKKNLFVSFFLDTLYINAILANHEGTSGWGWPAKNIYSWCKLLVFSSQHKNI